MNIIHINKSETGSKGEVIAKIFLEKKGYKIIEQNVRTKYSEIDLVAMKNDILVFVEVRTKTNEQFGSPEQTINKQKINRLIRGAESYITYNNHRGKSRIDAVCIVLDSDDTPQRIAHYESITF